MDKISFIIPAYNAEKYIVDCLNSIIKQRLEEYEIIIINDGSKDNTQKLCEDFISQNLNCQIRLINQINSGVSVARNRGIDEAIGEWVMFVDADDLLVESIFDHLNTDDLRVSDMILGDYTRNIEPTGLDSFKSSFIDSEIFLRCALRYSKYYKEIHAVYHIDPYLNWACWAKLYRRTWLVSNNIRFPEGIFTSEDCVFLIRAYAKKPRLLVTNFVMYDYRVNEQSVTKTFNPRIFENYCRVFDCLDQVVSSDVFSEDLDVYVAERMVDCIRRYLFYNKCKLNNEQLTSLVKVFCDAEHYKRVLRCPMKKVFIGKKNSIEGTYWLLRLKKIYGKM